MNRKALVTGASGYIGGKLCQQLLADGWLVDVLVRETGRPLCETIVGKVNLHCYDGSTESAMVAVSTARPDVVFHLASLVIPEHRSEQVMDLINSNLLFGAQLAEACARNGVKRFINTGTAWQHYRSDVYDPVCLYAATKQAFEDILDYYADAFGMCIVTLKLFDTYGPDDPRPKLINLLVEAMKSGDALGLTPGEQLLDLVYIDDVTQAFAVCAQQLLDGVLTQPHERYGVSSGKRISLRQLVALVAQISGTQVNVTFGARPYREREVMHPWNAGKPPFGWKVKISISIGLLLMMKLDHQYNARSRLHARLI